jgi:hypothetical protein
MPYADPDKRKQAKRDSARRRRAREAAAAMPDRLPEPPARDELLRLLGVQARLGHVQAIRALLEESRRDDSEAMAGPGADFGLRAVG